MLSRTAQRPGGWSLKVAIRTSCLPPEHRILEASFPGLTDELRAAGAVELDLCRDFVWQQAGGFQRRPSSSLIAPAMSRPLLEWAIRRRVMAIRNVELRGGVAARGIGIDQRVGRVNAVHLDQGDDIRADLVVDATGRVARTVDWLAEQGYPPPPTGVVDVDTRYVTRVFRRVECPQRDWKAAAVVGDPATRPLAMLLPMEGDRWILSMAGINGETPPTGEAEVLDYARQFDSPIVADLIANGEMIGEPVTHRFPSNHRRHVERLRHFPLGWVLLGDAVCSYDPIYGQGMTSAVLQAEALGSALDEHNGVTRTFARHYFGAVGRIVNIPWSIAVGGDFAYPGTKGTKPPGTDLLNRYMERVVKAGQYDDDVVIRLNEVVSLVRSPQALLAPAFVLRVLARARQADRARRRGAGRDQRNEAAPNAELNRSHQITTLA